MSKNATTIKGIEQNRANQAYEYAKKGSELSDNAPKEYKAYVKRIPMMIKTNGLGATFAFVFSKRNKSDAYGCIYGQVTDWIINHKNYLISNSDTPLTNDLSEQIVQLDSAQYRAVTVEVLALFQWMRRFAEGLIVEDEQP